MALPSRSPSPRAPGAAVPGVDGKGKGKGKHKGKGRALSSSPTPQAWSFCGRYLAGTCADPNRKLPHLDQAIVDRIKASHASQREDKGGKGKQGRGKGKGQGKPAAVVEQALESSYVKIEEVRD